MLARAPSQGAFIDAFAARVRARRGKPRWAEKTPQNIRHLDWILARFPEGVGRPHHPRRPGRRLLDARASRLALGGRRLAEGARAPAAGAGTRSAGSRTRPRAWPGGATRATSRSATRTSWRDPRRPCGALRAGRHRGRRGLAGGRGSPARWRASGLPAPGRARAASRRRARRRRAAPDYEGAVSAISVGRWRTDLSPAEQAEARAHLRGAAARARLRGLRAPARTGGRRGPRRTEA